MKAHLLFRDRDLDPQGTLLPNGAFLTQDLALKALFDVMARGDPFLLETARRVLLAEFQPDPDTIRYRQAVLGDCLRNHEAVMDLYAIALEALEAKRRQRYGFFCRYPSGILADARELLETFLYTLRKLSTAPQKRLTHQAALSSASRSALAKTLSNERRVHLNGLA